MVSSTKVREVTWYELSNELARLAGEERPFRISLSSRYIALVTDEETVTVPEASLYKDCRTVMQRRVVLRTRINALLNTAPPSCVIGVSIENSLVIDEFSAEQLFRVLDTMIEYPELPVRKAYSRTVN